MHGVIRRYRVRLGTVAQAARYTEKGFLPILRGIPGFVSSHLLDEGNDVLTWMALLETEEAAHAAVRASRDWFRDEWSSFRPLPPEVVTGEVLARATADGRRKVDRRRLALVGAIVWDCASPRSTPRPAWRRPGSVACSRTWGSRSRAATKPPACATTTCECSTRSGDASCRRRSPSSSPTSASS